MKNIAIIGAGASGLFLARKLLDNTPFQVYMFEKAKSVGTKLRASGGGKANIFNNHITADSYNQPSFIQQVLSKVNADRMRQEFHDMGLQMMADEEGRVYPLSQFSQTVVDVLWNPEHPNLHLELEYLVNQLCPQNDGKWRVNNYPILFDYVVMATGSPANMIPKNRLNYNAYLSSLHLKMQELKPSLVGFKVKNYPKSLAGCRVKVIASLYQNDMPIFSEQGEVTFKEDGVSGIVILNLSAYYNRLPSKENCSLALNFLYHGEKLDVKKHLQKFHSLKGILHPKLCALYDLKPFDIEHFTMTIDGVYDIEYAQVCSGGVAIEEVDENFALIRYPGAYITGELLDVDGVCGGYNLFFAFASALVVYESVLEGLSLA